MKVVITGMGVVSPIGCGVADFWAALCEGRSGLRDLTRFDTAGYAFRRGGEITGFALPDALREAAAFDPATQYLMAAALEALRGAGIDEHSALAKGAGVVLSTNFGGIVSGEAVLKQVLGKARTNAAAFREFSTSACADHVARRWHLTGPRLTLSLSCASGTAALGYGVDLIRTGRAVRVITGGYDALSPFVWSGLSALRTMTREEVRPFDRKRDGTLFSEGAGALVLEAADAAQARGAPMLAEVAGFALNNNAFHMTAPAKEGRGSAEVMAEALRDADLPPEAVDHINAHGTGTGPNDVTESQAIHAVFGERARRIPVTSNKSIMGHMMGAAGSAEAIASVMTVRTGVIPPTIHLREQDPACDLDVVAPGARKTPVAVALSNSAGIGGCNAAVVLRAYAGGPQ